jgi:hypothetical protein
VVASTTIPARIFFRAVTVTSCVTNNWYWALKNAKRASAREELRFTERIPSESLESRADPASQTTPSESKMVEVTTFALKER